MDSSPFESRTHCQHPDTLTHTHTDTHTLTNCYGNTQILMYC